MATVIDRLDAARALLGCVSVSNGNSNVEFSGNSGSASTTNKSNQNLLSFGNTSNFVKESNSTDEQMEGESMRNGHENFIENRETDWEISRLERKQATNAKSMLISKSEGGLDALAMLAFSATIADIKGQGDDRTRDTSPIVVGRARSASCPEGMEKWDSYGRNSQQMHFAEPVISTIREDQQLSFSHANSKIFTSNHLNDVEMRDGSNIPPPSAKLPFKKRGKLSTISFQNRDTPFALDDINSVAMSICSIANRPHSKRTIRMPQKNYVDMIVDAFHYDEPTHSSSNLNLKPTIIESPTESLRRTRARLLEDLHESSNANGEKGVMKMPHLLSKYKELYNKNGRIGIYTPGERAAIIAKFNSKRSRRVWNKKIRYNCRKNLADRRVRVKGRFVKRSSEEAAALASSNSSANDSASGSLTPKLSQSLSSTSPPGSVSSSTSNSPSPSPTPAFLPTVSESEAMDDNDNTLDINDQEAGFEPTEDQPFRRTRRYTIT